MILAYKTVTYQSGFKYQLTADASVQTEIFGYDIDEDYYSLNPQGVLTGKKGYSWDGASWCPDFKSVMRGSLFHDIQYQMMRLRQIHRSLRKEADKLLRRLCIEDDMWKWFANFIIYKLVRRFGKGATHPDNKRKVYTAP